MPVTSLNKGSTMFAAGIYADMTVDGPEIGTLVVIVDRAKNLPNRKSMGKQDPYCNCRLAKEAKKTKTDKRGGQVPRWDEEMRFTVRDSPDYYQLKVSIFNDDKKTELIGESWLDLVDVIKSGGGQSDIWHNLNCKGKYAGEVRLEMTFYDSRPKPERVAEEVESTRDVSSGSGARQAPVKRRPLPSDPITGQASPDNIGRAGGPRELGTPSRSLPQPVGGSAGNTPSGSRKTTHNNNNNNNNNSQSQAGESRLRSQQSFYPETPDDVFAHTSPQPAQQSSDLFNNFGGFEANPPPRSQHEDYSYQDDPTTGLPELPPMTNHRRQDSNKPQQQESYRIDYSQPAPARPQPELHHARSAPQVPITGVPPHLDDMTHPRGTFQHTQSDSLMHHGQSAAHQEYDDPYQRPHDDYSPQHHHQEVERRSSYGYPAQPPPPQKVPVHEGYNHIPPNSVYRQPSFQYVHERPPSSHSPYQHDAPPPPPPAHRDSTPSRQDTYSNYTPAPLNITSRRSLSPMSYHEPEQYGPVQKYGTPEFGGPRRRDTAPVDILLQDSHVYRPRARSGDAMRDSHRSPSRDSHDDYALPPSHPDYHSATTGTAPAFPDPRHTPSHRRDSYQPTYQPQTRSPLAVESPHSFRDDSRSLPPQHVSPSRESDAHQQPLAPRASPLANRPYSSHHYASSEPFVPQTSYQTPPRQHPLAQQLPVGSSPTVYIQPNPHQQLEYSAPVVKPIAISPVATPTSERYARAVNRTTPSSMPPRKSVSPRPPPSNTTSSSIFDNPDSFARFNPAALSSTSSLVNHPATSSHGSTPDKSVVTREGKIVDFHGNHIDPSDRLPETSWAPEPEPKVLPKEKPIRDRIGVQGARDLNVTFTKRGSAVGLSEARDDSSPVGGGGGGVIRARLRKKERPTSALVTSSTANSFSSTSGIHDRPFRDIPNPAPPPALDTHSSYSPNYGYTGSSPVAGYGYNASPSESPSYTAGGRRRSFYGKGNGSAAAPPIPAKLPMNESPGGYGRGEDVLARELASIDIGPGNGARVARGRMLGFRN